MRTLKLQRLKQSSMGIVGLITENGNEICQTLELPWVNNEQNVSCIPDGVYFCKRVNSPHFGNVFEITKVKDRTHVLIHAGNYLKDTNGCVLLGLQNGEANGQYCIYKSKAALEIFMKLLKDENEFCLEIK